MKSFISSILTLTAIGVSILFPIAIMNGLIDRSSTVVFHDPVVSFVLDAIGVFTFGPIIFTFLIVAVAFIVETIFDD